MKATAEINNAALSGEETYNELNVLQIKGAHYDAAKQYLPYYLEKLKVNSDIPALKLAQVAVRELTNQELGQIAAYKHLIGSDFNISVSTSVSRHETYAHFRIIPLRLNNFSGRYELLTSYRAEWDYAASVPVVNNTHKKTAAAVYASNSVLATGKWYKVAVTKSGVYKIDKTLLQSIGLSTTGLNPQNIRIYGNGGKLMPEKNSGFRYDDLMEDAIYVQGESDGAFDAGDYILFYGQSTDIWKHKAGSCLKFDHQLNYYSDTSYYYITADLGPGKRIQSNASLSVTPTGSTSSYDYYDYHEQNLINVVKSGREFYGEKFELTNTYGFSFNIPDAVLGDSVLVSAGGLSRSDNVSSYLVSYGASVFTYTCPNTSTTSYIADYGFPGYNCGGALLNSNPLVISVTKTSSDAVGYLDYVVFNARRNLVYSQSQFCFRDSRSVAGTGTTAMYTLTDNSTGGVPLLVWDVTDPINPKNQLYSTTGNSLSFISTTDSLREYVVTGSDFMVPKAYGVVPNQNLHGIQQADFVIICNPKFLSQANRLAAIHQQYDTLTYAVATTEQVYNEFSSGTPDIVSIREFARMLYKRPSDPTKAIKYLCLLGGGSYDNKNRFSSSNSALIPTYETPISWSYTNSFVTDDFFGLMDDNEGDLGPGDAVDIGVGRFPVRSEADASGCVNKIDAYYKKNYNFDINASESSCTNAVTYPQGDWRNWVCFMADDEDGGEHMWQADSIARMVTRSYPEYNVDKIIFDAYVQYSTPGGQRYPDVVNDLNRRFEKGTLIFNYTGHGGELGLAHERILEVSQILDWKNIANMPLMVTATCEFSRFDNPDITSAGEDCFLNPNGGAVSLFTTVRLAFSNLNFELNKSFFRFALAPMPNGRMPALGDIYRENKVDIGYNPQYQNFVILGDPALRLAYPQQRVYTSTINSSVVSPTTQDTLKALSKVTVKGYVGDKAGNKLSNFNGVIYPTVFDKSMNIVCLMNDPTSAYLGGPFKFNLQKNVIYKGKAQVVNGDFSFTFMVPKDISYQFGVGKISYYAHNGVIDANGYNTNIVIGGSDPNAVIDNQGPVVKLYMNDNKFVSGGTTNEAPSIYAEVADSSGINTVGTGIGHDIVAVLDENSNKPMVLNDYYEANLNSYQAGKIHYALSGLSEGTHRLSLKVWDVQNNSSTAYTEFIVAQSAELALSHILNYPNPFTTKTRFFIEHNQCCTTLKVMVQIYTITGKLVKSIPETITNEGFRFDGIEWDGKDDFGDKLARGVYVYKVSVTDGQSKKAEKIEKLVILN
ncbi:MAG: type IX secretion system sortase PorU [Bacteroidetes bacterium]|nr:type IX secretion system sortase PorU [Bacteroidota bacterium]